MQHGNTVGTITPEVLQRIRFLHARSDLSNQFPRSGKTNWFAERMTIRLGWEWAEIRPGVVCIADPMRISLSHRLVSADGKDLPVGVIAILLSTAIFMINDWQSTVSRLARVAEPCMAMHGVEGLQRTKGGEASAEPVGMPSRGIEAVPHQPFSTFRKLNADSKSAALREVERRGPLN